MTTASEPAESVSRTLKPDQPVSELPDEYCRFVECTPGWVTNFTLGTTPARNPGFKKRKAAPNGAGKAAPGAQRPS